MRHLPRPWCLKVQRPWVMVRSMPEGYACGAMTRMQRRCSLHRCPAGLVRAAVLRAGNRPRQLFGTSTRQAGSVHADPENCARSGLGAVQRAPLRASKGQVRERRSFENGTSATWRLPCVSKTGPIRKESQGKPPRLASAQAERRPLRRNSTGMRVKTSSARS